jgi:hypothetical protein
LFFGLKKKTSKITILIPLVPSLPSLVVISPFYVTCLPFLKNVLRNDPPPFACVILHMDRNIINKSIFIVLFMFSLQDIGLESIDLFPAVGPCLSSLWYSHLSLRMRCDWPCLDQGKETPFYLFFKSRKRGGSSLLSNTTNVIQHHKCLSFWSVPHFFPSLSLFLLFIYFSQAPCLIAVEGVEDTD